MFRPTLLLNAASKATLYRSAPAFSRFYSAGALSQTDIESRVLDILKGFDKIDQSKVNKKKKTKQKERERERVYLCQERKVKLIVVFFLVYEIDFS